MTVMNVSQSDIGFSQKVLYGIEKMFSNKTSTEIIKVSREQSDTIKTMYAFNPVTKTLVEIDPAQAWFWKPEWLDGEIQAEQDLRSGNYEEFDNLDDFIDSL